MFVNERFELPRSVKSELESLVPNFGYDGFGEAMYYVHYSRQKKNETQEHYHDTITRITEGTFSIRKDWYKKNQIKWDEYYWQDVARNFAISMFQMSWLPPGRGMWAMGTDYVYERGAMALYNCAFTKVRGSAKLANDISWAMDALMHGVGVGFMPTYDRVVLERPTRKETFVVPDTKEGWCELIWRLIVSYTSGGIKPIPDVHLVRPKNTPIKGFGGLASGPEPLIELYERIDRQLTDFRKGDELLLKTNIMNQVGCCVVAGNVRRSAELSSGSIQDQIFLNLKDYSIYPERADWGWMSNNSAILDVDEDFERLGEIAKRVIKNGEPGILNLRNFPYARIGKRMNGLKRDKAIGLNPCGEIPLEHREVCNISETFPTVCNNIDEWYKACEFATLYCSTVSLLPTHQPSTNKVVLRNRRIGVGLSDYTGWIKEVGTHNAIRYMRQGYKIVRATNKKLNGEAGVPESLRVTTVKPGGTVPKLPGRTSGGGFPTSEYTLRRFNKKKDTPLYHFLVNAGVPYEELSYEKGAVCFKWPIKQGPAKPACEATLWEQAINLITLSREWADNAVSNTLYFKPMWVLESENNENPDEALEALVGTRLYEELTHYIQKEYVVPNETKYVMEYDDYHNLKKLKVYSYDSQHEEDAIEPVLSSIVPLVKSLSLLPHTPKGVYKQMPEEEITKEEYEQLKRELKPVNWKLFSGSDGTDEQFCMGPQCEIVR